MDEKEKKLVPLRQKIDQIDSQIISLINQRAETVHEVGLIKGGVETAVFRPEREDQILERIAASSTLLDRKAVRAIYREILSACRALERETSVAYLGPEGTFSEMAVLKRFGSAVATIPCSTIDDVFRITENNTTDFGVVPIENSSQGTVTATLDRLFDTPLTIVGEVRMQIVHNLLSLSGDRSKIKTVTAHPQALAQCHKWLREHLPNALQVSCRSNAEGAKIAAGDPTTGAIAALRAADIYGLVPAAEGIQDWAGNQTRFLVLGHHPTHKSTPPLSDKTTFEFSTPNRPGALFEILEPLAAHGVSMGHLESRPARNGAWDYNFFVDIEGHIEDEHVRLALDKVREASVIFKLLGSYPEAKALD